MKYKSGLKNNISIYFYARDFCSLDGKTFYYKISWSFEAMRFVDRSLKIDRCLDSTAAETPVKF